MRAAAASPARAVGPAEPVSVYVWDLIVRITHWLIFASLTVLAVTGFYIGRPFIAVPGEAGAHFVMGTMKAIHFYAAIAFTLAVVSRLLWMLVGSGYARWDQFFPVRRDRRQGLWPTLKFYLFVLRRPPEYAGHNPVAGATYLLVYLLCLVEIATGLGLYSVSADVGSPLGAFGFLLPLFGGLQTARWIHHAVMWLLIGFFVHHLYSAWLVTIVERNATMDSIFSGYKFVHPEVLQREEKDRRGRR